MTKLDGENLVKIYEVTGSGGRDDADFPILARMGRGRVFQTELTKHGVIFVDGCDKEFVEIFTADEMDALALEIARLGALCREVLSHGG
jgi:hypothetical protein